MIELRELWIDGFGCLRTPRDPFRFHRRRINLFLDDNEAGKTTLQMAILASLYGVESHKGKLRSKAAQALLRPHHDHWFPLSGPPFSTRLRLHDGTRLLEIRWNFASDSDFRIVDIDTNRDVTEEVCPGGDPLALGHRLLGLSIEEFTKTCLVRQDDLARVREPEGLDALVQRAADTQSGNSTVASAQERLRDLLRSYPGVMLKEGGRIENEIKRLQDDIASLEGKLAELEAERAAIAEEDAEFQRLTAEREEQRREAARLEYLAQTAEYEELRQQLDEADKRRAILAELEAERSGLAHLEGFPADQADLLMQWQVSRLGLLHNAEQAERTVAEIRSSALEPARSELDGLRALAAVTQDDVDGVTELLGKTRDFEAREQKLRDAIARDEAQLASEGASIDELDRLEDRFARLEPGDGQSLTDHERATAQTVSELEEARRRALEAQLRIDRVMDERQRQRQAGRHSAIVGTAIAAGALVAAGLLALLHPIVALAIGGAGLAAAGWLIFRGHQASVAADSLRSEELARSRLELTQVEERREQLAARQRELDARLGKLAADFGYEQPEVLVEDYGSLDDLRRLCGTLIHLRKQEEGMAAQRREIEQEVGERFRAWGLELPPGMSLSAALDDLQERMARSLRLRHQIDELTRRATEETERGDALRREAEELTARIRGLLASARLGEVDTVEEAINIFHRNVQQFYRLQQLTTDLIPQAAATVPAAKDIEARRADAERLHRAIATLREERPSLVSLQVKQRAIEYRNQLTGVRMHQEELRVKADNLGREVLDTLSRYHAEQPRLQEALAERKQQLARALRHAAAIEMAIRVLDEIGLEVHGRWAEELNRSTSDLLQRLAPTLSDLKFDSRLCFGVWHSGGETPVNSAEASPILSAGTWDQLYLAVRLGLADFVARRSNGSLILLDDPFAHFDDARFEAAVRLLAELAHGPHQVLLFSCQRQRFNWLRSRDPHWFEANLVRQSIRGRTQQAN